MNIKQEFSTLSKSIRWMVKGLQNPVTDRLEMDMFFTIDTRNDNNICYGCAATNAVLSACGFEKRLISTLEKNRAARMATVSNYSSRDTNSNELSKIEYMIDYLRNCEFGRVITLHSQLYGYGSYENEVDVNAMISLIDQSIEFVNGYDEVVKEVDAGARGYSTSLRSLRNEFIYKELLSIRNEDIVDGVYINETKLDRWLELADFLEAKGY